MKRVAVIGGGLTGLAAAHRLNEIGSGIEVELFEATGRTGGVLHTEKIAPFLVEHSADMFTTMDPAALQLCERIGLSDQLIGTNQQFQRAFIAQGNALVPVPRGLNLMTPSDLDGIRETSLLSDEGKQRFLAEEFVGAQPGPTDESLESFAIRRFGEEAYRQIIQPLVGGIYTADPTRLSLRATLPQYLEMEAKHGSIIAATRAKRESANSTDQPAPTSGARYNMFLAPKGGMASLIAALRGHLTRTTVRTSERVTGVRQQSGFWQLVLESGTPEDFDALILTCPANEVATMVREPFASLAELLGQIEYASSAIVVQGFQRQQIEHPLDGFGFVVPLTENRKILAGSFSSVKFAGRADEDHVLTRTFIGGGCQPELLAHSDAELADIARHELGELLKITGDPVLEKVVRWNHSMPQYHLGHLDRVAEIESLVAAIPGLEIAGKSFRGVGIPACVRSGEQAAERMAEFLNSRGV